jgi:hypothetical protein
MKALGAPKIRAPEPGRPLNAEARRDPHTSPFRALPRASPLKKMFSRGIEPGAFNPPSKGACPWMQSCPGSICSCCRLALSLPAGSAGAWYQPLMEKRGLSADRTWRMGVQDRPSQRAVDTGCGRFVGACWGCCYEMTARRLCFCEALSIWMPDAGGNF